ELASVICITSGATRVFPLGFSRQPVSVAVIVRVQSADDLLNIIPRHLLDGPPVAAEVAGAVSHHGLPLGLRDFILSHFKWLTDADAVGGLFGGAAGIRTHHKLAGGNLD